MNASEVIKVHTRRAGDKAIEITNLRKRYGEFEALKGISFGVDQGEFFGLLGYNGAGKSTLINITSGIARASSGSVKILGHDVRLSYREARANLGVVPQEIVFDPFLTVLETLHMQYRYYGLPISRDWTDELLHHMDLSDKADVNMRNLSGGMKRRLMIAQSLVHKPRVIVLDEPTSGVDTEVRQKIWEFISRLNREGHTVILTSHNLPEVEALCTRIALLKNGQVMAIDRKDALIASFSDLVLYIRLVDGAVVTPEVRAALPGIEVSESHRECRICLKSYDEISSILNLFGSNSHFEEIRIGRGDLESVFLKIMKKSKDQFGGLTK